ncbi:MULTISPECIES: YgaP family membrane protein [Tsukamurella]|uniref:Inner membrane protein YgaP-like transmembrane domain-containing protein n=1 Tax=Tsukamurella pulmonis TaxID=47312 RepID=A0A1H1AF22_9ACTN|nr:DUF2892 domain-containing protein [Tsukamurella pulmonis]SDQ38181.1 Protein of unknown function [Tsukamurella pulmonis]SUQ39346.1 Inner membrane protein ygaP [Tsukamurella pulmonis]
MRKLAIDRAVLLLAGTLNLTGVALSVTASSWWILLALFVSVNLIQSSLTGFCPAARLLTKTGMRSGKAF